MPLVEWNPLAERFQHQLSKQSWAVRQPCQSNWDEQQAAAAKLSCLGVNVTQSPKTVPVIFVSPRPIHEAIAPTVFYPVRRFLPSGVWVRIGEISHWLSHSLLVQTAEGTPQWFVWYKAANTYVRFISHNGVAVKVASWRFQDESPYVRGINQFMRVIEEVPSATE